MERGFLKLPRRLFGSLALVAALALLVWAGCSNDDNPTKPPGGGGTPTTTSMVGAFVSGTANGALSVTINSTTLAPRLSAGSRSHAMVTASGTITPVGGAAVSLAGTYDTESDSLDLAGGGYDFLGQTDTTGTVPLITGGWTGPGGPGIFGCAKSTSSIPVNTYCGTFINEAADAGGNWDLLVSGSDIGGIAWPAAGVPFNMEGTLSGTGNIRNVTLSGGDGTFQMSATGTINMTTHVASGDWQTSSPGPIPVDTGTWTGTLCP